MSAPSMLRVVERETLVFRRLWRGAAFSYFVQPILNLAALGIGLGGLVDANSGDVDGYSYLVFVTPGLLAASSMQLASAESLWPVMMGTKWMRTYHGMATTPLSPYDIFGGHVIWIGTRVMMSATAFLLVAALWGGVPSVTAPLAIPAAVLCAAAFAAPITAFSATQDTDVGFSLVMRLGVLPLFLFSGTFFPVEQLPDRLEALVWLSPLWHGVELCRAATTGELRVPEAAAHIAVLVAFVAGGAAWGRRTFTRKITQ